MTLITNDKFEKMHNHLLKSIGKDPNVRHVAPSTDTIHREFCRVNYLHKNPTNKYCSS